MSDHLQLGQGETSTFWGGEASFPCAECGGLVTLEIRLARQPESCTITAVPCPNCPATYTIGIGEDTNMKTYTSEQLGQRLDEACAAYRSIIEHLVSCGRRACLSAKIETEKRSSVDTAALQEIAKLCSMVETHDRNGFEDAPAVQEEKSNLVMGPSGSPKQPGETESTDDES